MADIGTAATGTVLVGSGSGASPAFSATPSVTSLTISGTPSAGTDATNVTYVTNAITAVNPATSVVAATTANLNANYLNGVGGIGASLTNAGALVAFTIDGQTPTLNQRVLVKNQASTFQNGVYTVATLGTGAVAWILIRSLDYDAPSDINNTGVINVLNGTANALTGWLINSTVTTVGTDAITYTQYNAAPISVTQHAVLIGGVSNAVVSTAVGATGTVLQGNTGADPTYSTATYPSIATGTGTLLRADGTNWVATTSTYPNTNAINTLLYASSANVMSALATANNGVHVTGTTGIPSVLAAGTSGALLQSGAPAAWTTATYPTTAGTAGNVLKSDGTNIISSSNSGNHVLIQSQTASSVSSLTFTTGITGYDIYFLQYYGITNSAGAANLAIQVSTDGGSTYQTTNYVNNGYYSNNSGLTNIYLTAFAGMLIATDLDNTAAPSFSGNGYLYNFGNASLHKQFVGQGAGKYASISNISTHMGCEWSTVTVVNAFKILIDAGNMSGTFKLYGIQN